LPDECAQREKRWEHSEAVSGRMQRAQSMAQRVSNSEPTELGKSICTGGSDFQSRFSFALKKISRYEFIGRLYDENIAGRRRS
jgi:hypothetical protein